MATGTRLLGSRRFDGYLFFRPSSCGVSFGLIFSVVGVEHQVQVAGDIGTPQETGDQGWLGMGQVERRRLAANANTGVKRRFP